MVGVQINEPPFPTKNIVISKIDLELEREKKGEEDLAKELEKVANEVEVDETRRKIHFIKSTFDLTTWQNQASQPIPSIPVYGPMINSQGFSQSIPASSSTTTNQLTIEYPKTKDNYVPHDDLGTFILEYESNSEVGGNYFATLDRIQMIVAMKI